MKRIRDKAHIVFWTLGIVLFAFQIYFTQVYPNSTFDINVHDTYYVVAHAHIFNVLGTWIILCGMGYWILKLCRVRILALMFWLHLILTILFTISLWVMDIEIKPGIENLELYKIMQSLWFFGLILFGLGQISYFLNILISTLRRVASK